MWQREFVDTTRGRFEVLVQGRGKPLCVTHLYSAFNENGDHFANVFIPYRQVHLVNLRGAGGSSKATDESLLDMEQAVEDLETIRDALGLERWEFAGHSTGGMLGLMYAGLHERSLLSLTIVGAAASNAYVAQPDCIYHPEHPSFHRMQELRSLQLHPGISPEEKRLYGIEITKLSLYRPHRYADYFPGTTRKSVVPVRLDHFGKVDFPKFDLGPALGDVSTQTLIACGRYDVQCPLRCSVEIHELMPNSELVIFEQSNHYPFLEEPSLFSQCVGKFLRSVVSV